jgi:hypothetical protein
MSCEGSRRRPHHGAKVVLPRRVVERFPLEPRKRCRGGLPLMPHHDTPAALQPSWQLKLVIVDVLAMARKARQYDGSHAVVERLHDAARAPVDKHDPSAADQPVELRPRTPLQPSRLDVRERRGVTVLHDELFALLGQLGRKAYSARKRLTVRPEDQEDHSSVPAYSALR